MLTTPMHLVPPLPDALRYTSCFAGIGGFDLAADRLGMVNTAQIEWNKDCQKILGRHFAGRNLMGDIRDVRGTDVGEPDVWVGGFPCQDTAVAAPHRAGLAGKRSGHFIPFIELLAETQRILDESRPRWVAIENPDGVLSSPGVDKETGIDRTGWDMAAIVRALADCGYGVAYRVVDGGLLGSPFRRRRVLVVGHFGGDPGPAWDVLGDPGDRSQAGAPRQVSTGRAIGPVPDLPVGVDGLWRKVSNPRKSLSKGGYETWVADSRGNTLTPFDWGNAARQKHLLAQHGRLRTNTLLEWERGLGVPDQWTEGVSDSARAQGIANAMQVGMADWFFTRLIRTNARWYGTTKERITA
jgi:DNA (cytosine-5)-methyltransferase 1